MTVSDYSTIKQQIVFNVGESDRHCQLFNTLKESFRDVINSPRRYEEINKIGQLLKVLEIRDVLSPENVEPLKLIARKLDSDEILSRIADYEASYVKREFSNQYALKNKENEKARDPLYNINCSPYAAISISKKNRIIGTLTEEIGTYWRDLGRNLNIRECTIDEIDKGNISIYEKASKLMKVYERRADPQKWFLVLCEALDRSRRRDLSRTLNEIMMMNI